MSGPLRTNAPTSLSTMIWTGVSVAVGEGVKVGVGVRVWVGVWVVLGEGVADGVSVALGVSVGVAVGTNVAVGGRVGSCMMVGGMMSPDSPQAARMNSKGRPRHSISRDRFAHCPCMLAPKHVDSQRIQHLQRHQLAQRLAKTVAVVEIQ